MTTRASTTAAAGDANPRKRQRVESDSLSGDAVSLEIINDNCMLVVLAFLEAEDLNSLAVCSRRCREARSSPSLDQTRTGTIICTHNWSIIVIDNAISRGGWNNDLYSGNRTRLRVVGLEKVGVISTSSWEYMQQRAHNDDVQLTGVTSLDLSYTAHDIDRSVGYIPFYGLALVLPNLRELDLRNVEQLQGTAEVFCDNCPHLMRLTWNGTDGRHYPDGRDFSRAENLTEVYMDGTHFDYDGQQDSWEREPTFEVLNCYMYMYCKRLERLSIKNAKWVHAVRLIENRSIETTWPISQGMIIKFVRHSPTLRWLRSDLTEENVAILQQERPDVTFVTD